MVDFNKEQDMVQNTSSVLEFPVEVLLQILSHLDAQSLIRLSAVSRRLRILAYDRSLWRNVTLIYPELTSQFQWPEQAIQSLRYFSRLVERTPLRYECLRSFNMSCVRDHDDEEHIARYEVARDLMVLSMDCFINLAIVQFRYVYHLTNESVTISGGNPFLLPPGTSRNDISSMPMPTPITRRQSMSDNQYWFHWLLSCGRRGSWLFSI